MINNTLIEQKEPIDSSEKTKDGNKGESSKDMQIHVMPKEFTVLPEAAAKKARGVGLLILAAGVAALLVIFAFFYMFILKPDNAADDAAIKNENSQIQNNLISGKETPKKAEEPSNEEENAALDKKEEANINTEEEIKAEEAKKPTSTPVVIHINATSTEESTSTDKAIDAKDEKSTSNIALANDTDQDGLADIEEVLLDSDIKSADSDGDGYSDLDELLNLYNPSGAGILAENDNIQEYVNPEFKYKVLIPTAWSISKVGGDESLLLELGNKQFIQIIIEANERAVSLDEWYKDKFVVDKIEESQKLSQGEWQGIKSDSELYYYLSHPKDNSIYIISYNLGVDNIIYYKNIFTMMINSIELQDQES